MKTVCKKNTCVGCMACLESCPKNAISIQRGLKYYNAVIGDDCINCGVCHRICQNNHPAMAIDPQKWYQGWANLDIVRQNGSSGGLAMALANSFVETGGIVCSCFFFQGEFTFKFVNTVDELGVFAGSKYVKSNPYGIYKEVRKRLKHGGKILFIGLPCQVSALKNYIGDELSTELYTIDLICHGTPSPKVLDIFLKQHGYNLEALHDVSFRSKNKYFITGDNKSVTSPIVCDCYMISFLGSLSYTGNCYECEYAKVQRVSDLTLGDSWGSNLPKNEREKGISLILCQTTKGEKLLHQSNVHLERVDLAKAIKYNNQLKYPSVKPKKWNWFLDQIDQGESFDYSVFRCFPKQCLKQSIKQILIATNIIPGV